MVPFIRVKDLKIMRHANFLDFDIVTPCHNYNVKLVNLKMVQRVLSESGILWVDFAAL